MRAGKGPDSDGNLGGLSHVCPGGCQIPWTDFNALLSSSYNPFDGPNENPEAELPLVAGKYLYVYGDMDEDGFYEGLGSRLGVGVLSGYLRMTCWVLVAVSAQSYCHRHHPCLESLVSVVSSEDQGVRTDHQPIIPLFFHHPHL